MKLNCLDRLFSQYTYLFLEFLDYHLLVSSLNYCSYIAWFWTPFFSLSLFVKFALCKFLVVHLQDTTISSLYQFTLLTSQSFLHSSTLWKPDGQLSGDLPCIYLKKVCLHLLQCYSHNSHFSYHFPRYFTKIQVIKTAIF